MAIAVKLHVIFGEPASLTGAHAAENVWNSSCQKAESCFDSFVLCVTLQREERGLTGRKTRIAAATDIYVLHRNKVKVFVLAGGSHELALLHCEIVGSLKMFISFSLALKHRRQ